MLGRLPTDGLVHQHDATQLSLSDGATVNTWPDESGNGNDLSSTGGPTFEANALNGVDAVRCDGVDDYFDSVAAINSSQPNQIFAVMEIVTRDSSGVGNQVITNASSCASGRNDIFADTGDLTIFSGTSVTSSTASDTNPHIYEAEFDTTDVLRLDGADIVSGDAGSQALDTVRIGANCNLGEFGDQRYGELLVYNRSLSAFEESNVRSYLSDKWGITV